MSKRFHKLSAKSFGDSAKKNLRFHNEAEKSSTNKSKGIQFFSNNVAKTCSWTTKFKEH